MSIVQRSYELMVSGEPGMESFECFPGDRPEGRRVFCGQVVPMKSNEEVRDGILYFGTFDTQHLPCQAPRCLFSGALTGQVVVQNKGIFPGVVGVRHGPGEVFFLLAVQLFPGLLLPLPRGHFALQCIRNAPPHSPALRH